MQSEAGATATNVIPSLSSTRRFADINISTQGLEQCKTEPCNEQSLPPTNLILKILRLTQVTKQRFFVDIPIIDEDEFANYCNEAYLATAPSSIPAQVIAIVGMYYLIHDLDTNHYGDMELTVALVDSYLHTLRGTVQAAYEELRLCMEMSFEHCQALSLLGMFSLKEGRIEAAWRLLSSAARMCLDLGMNCSQPADHKDQTKSKRLLWWVYAINQSPALTLGRTPAIRQRDIDLDCPELVASRDGVSSP
jgi:hypothetical protein